MMVEGAAATDGGELRLVKKHPRAIRWMHWINFPLLAIMIWSGLLIYWGDSIPPYQHPHEVYRIGIGHWTLMRFFPDWFWNLLHAPVSDHDRPRLALLRDVAVCDQRHCLCDLSRGERRVACALAEASIVCGCNLGNAV